MMDDVQWLSALVSIESLLSRLERDDGNDSSPCRLFLFVYVLEIFYPSAIRICERYVVFCRFELFNLKDRYVYVREILFFVSKRKRERERVLLYCIILFQMDFNVFSFFLSFKEVDFILINEHFFLERLIIF